jgi:hypothetical protein
MYIIQKRNPMTQFEGYEILNPNEQQFLACLEAVSDDTAWGLAVKQVMQAPTVTKIRQLIADLKSQAADDALIMLSILGNNCYLQLKNL